MSQESMCKIDTSGSQQGAKATKTVSSANGIWETVYLNLPVSSHLVGCVPLHGTYKSSFVFLFLLLLSNAPYSRSRALPELTFPPHAFPNVRYTFQWHCYRKRRDLTTCEIHRPTISGPRHMNSINAAKQSRTREEDGASAVS